MPWKETLTFSAAARGLRVAGKPGSAAGSRSDLAFGGTLSYRFAPRSDLAGFDELCGNLGDG